MENITKTYWPLMRVCNCLDKQSREKVFNQLAHQKDFRKLMKAFMRHVCGKQVKVTKLPARQLRKYRNAVVKLGQPSRLHSKAVRRKCIRQIGGALPFHIPVLASIVGEIVGSQL